MKRTIKTLVKYPNGKKGYSEISGNCYIFKIGTQKIKFMVHTAPESKASELFLSHYKSGQKIGSLTPIRIRHMKSYLRLTDRSAAETLINELIDKHGVDRVLTVINSAEVINK